MYLDRHLTYPRRLKAIQRKLDNQFCDIEISLIFPLVLSLRRKIPSWYAHLFHLSVFFSSLCSRHVSPHCLILFWHTKLLDQWQAVIFDGWYCSGYGAILLSLQRRRGVQIFTGYRLKSLLIIRTRLGGIKRLYKTVHLKHISTMEQRLCCEAAACKHVLVRHAVEFRSD